MKRLGLRISLLLAIPIVTAFTQQTIILAHRYGQNVVPASGGALPQLVVQLGNPAGVGLVAYSPDGKLAMTSDDSGRIK